MQLEEGPISPLTCQEFNELMAGLSLDGLNKIAVAVSGGGDSMALVYLLIGWCKDHGVDLEALTVDHGLRAASNDEAIKVSKWLTTLGVSHHILKWLGNKPTANIQSEARQARYELMGDWCAEREITHLFLAHHMDDQAETFLIRLFRGSGVDGLSAMERISGLPVAGKETMMVRPLLNIKKVRLLQTLKEVGQEWISDPSNENKDFTRVKVRALLESSDIDGLNSEKLSKTAEKMSRVRSLLDELTAKAYSKFVKFNPLGYVELNAKFVEDLHEEIALRLLAYIVKSVSGGDYVPRYEKLLSFYNNLKMKSFSGQTLSGCVIYQNKKGQYIFVREANAVKDVIKISSAKQYLWDNRFVVRNNGYSGSIDAFSKTVLLEMLKNAPEVKEGLYKQFDDHVLRDYLLPTLPCMILEGGEVILPSLLISGEMEKIYPSFSAHFKK